MEKLPISLSEYPGYVGCPVSKIARKHQYYPRVKSRAEERLIKYRYPDSKPRR